VTHDDDDDDPDFAKFSVSGRLGDYIFLGGD